MLATLAVPKVPTVIVGVLLPARVRIFVPEALLSRVHPAAVAVVISPKVKLPMVRAESKLTVISAVTSSVLKSALKPEASAMVEPLQFAELLQSPFERLVHVPLAANAGTASAALAIIAASSLRAAGEPERALRGLRWVGLLMK